MLKRFLTGMVIIAITVGCFALRFVSKELFDVFAAGIILLSTYEVCKSFKNAKKYNDMIFVLMYPILLYLTLALCKANNLSLIAFFAIAIALLLLIFALTLIMNLLQKTKMNKEMVDCDYVGTRKKYTIQKGLRNLFLMLYPALVLSVLFVINHLKDFSLFAEVSGNLEFFILVMIFVTTMAADTFAYLIGSGLGGKKLCPKISPNKTISGAIGALFAGVACSLILFAIFSSIENYSIMFSQHNLGVLQFVLYGLFASIFTQIGDIFASAIKRKNNIKDFGKIFPGHGGVMDRVDGIAFNTIFSFVFVMICFL